MLVIFDGIKKEEMMEHDDSFLSPRTMSDTKE
jgi:hypothetical protein